MTDDAIASFRLITAIARTVPRGLQQPDGTVTFTPEDDALRQRAWDDLLAAHDGDAAQAAWTLALAAAAFFGMISQLVGMPVDQLAVDAEFVNLEDRLNGNDPA